VQRRLGASGPSAAVLRLQASAGNRAVGRLLQRYKGPTTPEEVEAWGADYTNATNYVIRFYGRIRSFLDEKEKAQKAAEEGFKSFKDLPEPPDLQMAIVRSIFSSVFGTAASMIPGAGALVTLIKTGSAIGDLAETAKESSTDEHAKDVGHEGKATEHAVGGAPHGKKGHAEAGEKAMELGKKGSEGAVEVHKTVKETRAKQQEAQEAEENAILFQRLAHKRIASWADVVKRSHTEEDEILAWLSKAQQSHKWRGGLVGLATSRLGAQLPEGISGDISLELARSYELEVFREYFKEKKAALVGVQFYGFEDDGEIYSQIELSGTERKQGDAITKPVRRHLIEDLLKKLPARYLGGWAEDLVKRWGYEILYDDEVLARVLGIHKSKVRRKAVHLANPIHGTPKELERQLRDYYLENDRPELKDVTRRIRLGLHN
jgi:hypothetical protein